jgi:hypothetical protein
MVYLFQRRALMSQVFEIIKRAGRIPLDELVLRSSEPPEVVADELRMLEKDGWIQITGDIPPPDELRTRAGDTLIMLTSRGLSALSSA